MRVRRDSGGSFQATAAVTRATRLISSVLVIVTLVYAAVIGGDSFLRNVAVQLLVAAAVAIFGIVAAANQFKSGVDRAVPLPTNARLRDDASTFRRAAAFNAVGFAVAVALLVWTEPRLAEIRWGFALGFVYAVLPVSVMDHRRVIAWERRTGRTLWQRGALLRLKPFYLGPRQADPASPGIQLASPPNPHT